MDKTTAEIILPVLLLFSLNTPLTINTITIIYQDDIETNTLLNVKYFWISIYNQ